jgi:hypothetical protein
MSRSEHRLWPGPLLVVLGSLVAMAPRLGRSDMAQGGRGPKHRITAVIVVAVGMGLFAASVHAYPFKGTHAEQREALRDANLKPVPLYPRTVPKKLRRGQVDLEVRDRTRYVVTWDRGLRPNGIRRGYVMLSRLGPRALRTARRSARIRGFRPKRVRIRGRKGFWLCGHVCGFAWREQRRTFMISGIYYGRDSRSFRRDARAVARMLRPLHALTARYSTDDVSTPAPSSSSVIAQRVSRRVTLRIPSGTKPRVRPRRVYASHASRFAPWARELRQWEDWGTRRTRSPGVLYDPPQGSGAGTLRPGHVVLARIQRCRGNRRYRRVRFVYDAGPRNFILVVVNCRGDAVRIIRG